MNPVEKIARNMVTSAKRNQSKADGLRAEACRLNQQADALTAKAKALRSGAEVLALDGGFDVDAKRKRAPRKNAP